MGPEGGVRFPSVARFTPTLAVDLGFNTILGQRQGAAYSPADGARVVWSFGGQRDPVALEAAVKLGATFGK